MSAAIKPQAIPIGESITVKELANKLDTTPTKIIENLFKKGQVVTINQVLDYETARAVAEDSGVLLSRQTKPSPKKSPHVSKADGQPRPPIVAMMGHVDHGKTSLLDKIRKTNVVAQEAGGITQHLNAYQLSHGERLITFLDTPGHEAFAILRQHGAYLIDLAIIVVAADEGVKPQTAEAIKFAQKAGVKIMVAINKIDKPGSDINRLKQQLSELGLNPEDWGGDTVMAEVSAKTGQGIDKLLDLVLLVSDLEELKADPNQAVSGTVIESHMQKGYGPVATLLVEEGTLRPGAYLVSGSVYGKVRTLEATDGQTLKAALPSTPVRVAGWKGMPRLGDRFKKVADERTARAAIQQSHQDSPSPAMEIINTQAKLEAAIATSKQKQLPLVLKADTQGSIDAIQSSLEGLGGNEIEARVISSGLGMINESDVNAALTGGAQIVGFNVELSTTIKQLAERQGVKIRLYKVIYELLEDIKTDLEALLEPETVEQTLGSLEVKGIFKVTKNLLVCGGQVVSGKISSGLLVRWLKGGTVEEIGKLKSVEKAQAATKEVVEGEMCGLSIETKQKSNLAVGDKLEFFNRTSKRRSL